VQGNQRALSEFEIKSVTLAA
jgi:hypothetical protein